MKVSVIIPAYNRAGYISQAVESVLAQTYPDYEIVVVDDGSTDDTVETVRRFTDPRLRLICQENRGVSGALNAGLRNARGEYVITLGSDDTWLPELLAVEVAYLDAHPEYGLVFSRAQAMDAAGQPLPESLGAPQKFPGETLKSILYGDFVCAITALVRRALYDQAGFYDETQKGNEDWDMWTRLATISSFAFIDQTLARYRVHAANLTSRASPQLHAIIQGRVKVLDKSFNQPNLPAAIQAFKPIAYRNSYVETGLRWLAIKEYRLAGLSFFRAVQQGGNPIKSTARVFYSIAAYHILPKSRWGRQLVQWAASRRRSTRPEARLNDKI